MIQITAEALARRDDMGAPLRQLCARWFQTASATEQAAVIVAWYELDPDGLERAIKDLPGRNELHDALIKNYAKRGH